MPKLGLVLVALFFAVVCSSCLTRPQVRAFTWLNNSVPADVCEREPTLKDHGFYRRLNTGKLEFISFCDPRAQDWIGIYKTDFENILDQLLPKKRGEAK